MTITVQNDIIFDTVGEFGKWQKRAMILVFSSKIVACWCMAIILFTAPVPEPIEIRCFNDSSHSTNYLSSESDDFNATIRWHTASHPELVISSDKYFDIDFCSVESDIFAHIGRHNINSTSISELTESPNEVPCSEFRHRPFFRDKLTKFDWSCSRNLIGAFTQFFFLFGVLIGGIIAWRLLNIISPRNLLMCGILSQIITGILLAFVDNYKLHLLVRFLNSVSCAQMYTSGQTLLTDIISQRYLRNVLPVFETFWSIGELTMPILVYSMDSWDSYFLSIALPSIVYLIICFIWLPDSPRWHLQRGNIIKTAKIISDASIVNQAPCAVAGDFIEGLRPERFVKDHKKSGSWRELWKTGALNIVCIHLIAGATLCTFNGMLLNVRNFGGDNLHINISLTGVSEILGVLFAFLFIIENTRKWLWNGLINISVGFTVLFGYLSSTEQTFQKYYWPMMMLHFALKSCVSISATLVISSATTLVEPKHRPMLLLSLTIWSRMCLLVASTIASLSLFSTLLPLATFAGVTTMSGFAMCVINPRIVKQQKTNFRTNVPIELEEIEKLTIH